MKNAPHEVVTLNLPEPVAPLIVYGRHVVLVMTNNAWFPAPDPALAAVSSELDSLEAAEAKAQTKAKGAAAARDLQKKKVVDRMGGLRAYVQGIVNANMGQGAAVAESAGMFIKGVGAHVKANLAAVMGPTPGQVIVRAKAVKHASYEWQYSIDGAKTWISLGTTTVASTSVSGLAQGTTCLFRFRTTRGRTTSDWSQTISFYVH